MVTKYERYKKCYLLQEKIQIEKKQRQTKVFADFIKRLLYYIKKVDCNSFRDLSLNHQL